MELLQKNGLMIRSFNIKPTRELLLLSTLLLLLSGCASPRVSDLLHEDIEQNYLHHIDANFFSSGVALIRKRNEWIIRSGIRSAGLDTRRVSVDDLVPGQELTRGLLNVRMVFPPGEKHDFDAIFQGFSEQATSHIFDSSVDSIYKWLNVLMHIEGRPVDIKILVSSGSIAYTADIDSNPDKGLLRMIVASPPIRNITIHDMDAHAWWITLTSHIVHELVHLNQKVAMARRGSIDNSMDYKFNEEVSASVVQQCSEVDLVIAWMNEESAEMEKNGVETLGTNWTIFDPPDMFPELREGVFSPDNGRLNEFALNDAARSSRVAQAVFWLLSDDGNVYWRDPEQAEKRDEYCTHVANHVPRFLDGELH